MNTLSKIEKTIGSDQYPRTMSALYSLSKRSYSRRGESLDLALVSGIHLFPIMGHCGNWLGSSMRDTLEYGWIGQTGNEHYS